MFATENTIVFLQMVCVLLSSHEPRISFHLKPRCLPPCPESSNAAVVFVRLLRRLVVLPHFTKCIFVKGLKSIDGMCNICKLCENTCSHTVL